MSVPRAVHTATRLADGRILVAGGCSDAGCDLGSAGGATAEIFDPATKTFVATGGLTVSRDDHAAAPLPDGRVMLIGGWAKSGVLASTDVYDPRTGSFTPGPMMHTARAGLVPAPLADGRILLAGGFTGTRPTTAAAELYDPTTATMTVTGQMRTPRGAYAAARLPDGRVLIAGGLADGVVVATAELYDPATGTFGPVGSMSAARYKATAVALGDGTVLVIGGSGDIDGSVLYPSTEIYHSDTATFTRGPTMNRPRYKLTGSTAGLGGGKVLVAGGATQPELFQPASGSFLPVAGDLGATRLFLCAAAIDDHRVLLVGGYDRAIRPTAAAWLYDDRS
jgi:hypothetical protein